MHYLRKCTYTAVCTTAHHNLIIRTINTGVGLRVESCALARCWIGECARAAITCIGTAQGVATKWVATKWVATKWVATEWVAVGTSLRSSKGGSNKSDDGDNNSVSHFEG